MRYEDEMLSLLEMTCINVCIPWRKSIQWVTFVEFLVYNVTDNVLCVSVMYVTQLANTALMKIATQNQQTNHCGTVIRYLHSWMARRTGPPSKFGISSWRRQGAIRAGTIPETKINRSFYCTYFQASWGVMWLDIDSHLSNEIPVSWYTYKKKRPQSITAGWTLVNNKCFKQMQPMGDWIHRCMAISTWSTTSTGGSD